MLFRCITLILACLFSAVAHSVPGIAKDAPSKLSTLQGVTLGMSKYDSLLMYKKNSIPVKEVSADMVLINMRFNRRPATFIFMYSEDKLKMITVNISMVGKIDSERSKAFDSDAKFLESKFGEPSMKDFGSMTVGWKYDVGYVVYQWADKYQQFTLVFDGER